MRVSMISPKKFAKTTKSPPKGFKTSNDFFNFVFKDKKMIWMGQNTNHLLQDSLITDAMVECVNSGEYCKYPPPEGFPELHELILNDLGLENDFEMMITAGGTESLYLCINEIMKADMNMVTCDPGYLIIDNFASRFANQVISVPIYNAECNYKLTPHLVKEYMDENTKLISLIDPLNPLGSSYTKQEIKEFAEIAIENDIYLLHDITYRDFAQDHHLVAKYAPEHSLTIYSFSKIFGMAGLRIGGIIANPYLLNSIRNVLINDLGTNVLSQKAAIAGLKSKRQWIDSIKTQTRNNQHIIKKAVDKVDGAFLPVYPSDGNMMAIDLKETGIDPQIMADYLLDKKIFIRQGAYTSKLFGDRYIRLSFSVPQYQVKIFAEKFLEAYEALKL